MPVYHIVRIRGAFGKQVSSLSPPIQTTALHTRFLMVRSQLGVDESEAIIDCTACAPVVVKWLAKQLGVKTRLRTVIVRNRKWFILARRKFHC